MLPPEEELELLDGDIRNAERRLDQLGRDRSRVANEPEIGQSMWRLTERLKYLRAYRAALVTQTAEQDEEREAELVAAAAVRRPELDQRAAQ